MSKTRPVRLLICSTCTGARDVAAESAAVANALGELDMTGQVEIGTHACMNGCAHPVSIGLQGDGRASYVFAGVDPVADAADIAATCRVYLDSEHGWIEDARPCGRLRLCLRARLPAL